MSISAALSKIAIALFPSGVPHAFYKQNPGWMDSVKKTDQGKGATYNFSVGYSQGATGSALYANATSIASDSKYERFAVTTVTDYALARMNGEDYEKLSGSDGAVVDAWKDRVDTAYQEAIRSLSIQYFGTGTGSRGIVSVLSTVTLTLGTAAAASEPSRVVNFYVGMSVTASATDGATPRNSGAAEVIAGINRQAGTLTSTSIDWTTVITALVVGDFLYRLGDYNAVGTGMGAWVVGGTTPAALFGATRTTDTVALAGTALSGASKDMVAAVLELCSTVSIQDSSDKTLYVNPRDKVSLVKLLESRARYIRPDQKSSATAGVEFIEFETDSGPVKLKGDINVPVQQAFLLCNDHCETISVGKTPKPLEKDGQLVRARDGYDAYEMRIGSYYNFTCRAPFACGRLTSFGA